MSFPDARTVPPRLFAPPSGPVLVVVPRAGDELLGPGGTLALHGAQGDPLHQVAVFGAGPAGGQGAPPFPPDPRPAQDAPPAFASRTAWGLSSVPDPSQDDLFALARRLARILVERRPASLYAPWHGELELDAFIVSHAAALAVELADHEGQAWGYELGTPLVPSWVVDVSAVWPAKRAALDGHAAGGGAPHLARALEGLAAHRSLLLPAGATHGEAFAHLLDLRIPVPRSAAGSVGPRS